MKRKDCNYCGKKGGHYDKDGTKLECFKFIEEQYMEYPEEAK